MTITTEARNASFPELLEILKSQQPRKVDVVAPAGAITAEGGLLRIAGTEPVIDDDGVTMADALYLPTRVADESISLKLGIPIHYLRRLRAEHVDLWDENVNGWLARDDRSFLMRLFRDDSTGVGVMRAMLSDSYRVMDHLDVLLSALDGIRQAGVEVDIAAANLTETKMSVKITAPTVRTYARELLKGYRSPFTGANGSDSPEVFAGSILSNSETGDGVFTLTPSMTVQTCTNGHNVTKDAMRNVHLGSKMDDGLIKWSEETQEKNLALVKSRTADAVRTFLDVEYMTKVIARLEEKSSTPVSDPAKAVKFIAKKAAFTEAEASGILDHFIKGGQVTAGGFMQATTSFAQTIASPDRAREMEDAGLRVLDIAASL